MPEFSPQPFNEDWTTERFRFAFKTSGGLTISKGDLDDEGTPCLNYGEIHSSLGIFTNSDNDKLKCLPPTHPMHAKGEPLRDGDLVFADTSEDLAGSGNFTRFMGSEQAFAGYHTIQSRPRSDMRSRYFTYLFDSASVREQIRRRVNGVKVYSITQAVLADIKLKYPSLDEQERITSFLDSKTEKIDRAIAIKGAQIARLEERKQILIQTAVTRGLDSSVTMKDSGVDCIGEIPAHWKVKKAFHYFKASKGSEAAKLTKEYCESISGNYAVYSGQTSNGGVLSRINYFEFDYSQTGCMLCSTVGAKAMNIIFLQEKFSLSQNCMIITPRNPEMKMEFYTYAFSPIFKYFRQLIPDHMQASFRMEDFYQMKFLLPPERERENILTHVKEIETRISIASKASIEQIQHLKEYRASLINAAVTGKIKVPS